MGTITSASISKKVLKVLVYMCTMFGAFFIKCTIDLVCRSTNVNNVCVTSLNTSIQQNGRLKTALL